MYMYIHIIHSTHILLYLLPIMLVTNYSGTFEPLRHNTALLINVLINLQSWDEFEVEDTPIDQLVDPPSVPERKDSFMLPPDSPETTPTIRRRPSYLTPHEEIEEEEREGEEEREEEGEEREEEREEREEEREEREEEREEEEGEEVTPPPIPSSLPPEDDEEGQQDGVAVEREDEGLFVCYFFEG